MWTISELKTKGKHAFKKNYWRCVIIAFIMLVLTNGVTLTFCFNNDDSSIYEYENDVDIDISEYEEFQFQDKISDTKFDSYEYEKYMNDETLIVLILISIVFIFVFVLQITLFNPLYIGGIHFFTMNAKGNKTSISILLHAFWNNYLNAVSIMFIKTIKIFLWSLLFFIPGIIKHYEYCMVPYILADNPNMKPKEVFRKSKKMMSGYKIKTFILEMSFIGWNLLSVITLNLFGIFFSNPYKYATFAELYLKLNRPSLYRSNIDSYYKNNDNSSIRINYNGEYSKAKAHLED